MKNKLENSKYKKFDFHCPLLSLVPTFSKKGLNSLNNYKTDIIYTKYRKVKLYSDLEKQKKRDNDLKRGVVPTVPLDGKSDFLSGGFESYCPLLSLPLVPINCFFLILLIIFFIYFKIRI